MKEIPPNWIWAQVGDIVEFGPKIDCVDDTVTGFVPLQRLGVDFRSRHTFEPRQWDSIKKGYTHFADGDVLLARITPSFENGKAGIVRSLPNGIGAGSTEYFVCRPIRNAVLPEYLLAHFKTPKFLRDGAQMMSGAVGQQRVPKQYVLDSEIPLAPLNEQKRIADKLDAVLARVDACCDRLDQVPTILKRFRQAVLTAATSGRLTEDWREAHPDIAGGVDKDGAGDLSPNKRVDIPGTWRWVTFESILASIRGGSTVPPKGAPTDFPILRSSSVRQGSIDFSDIRFVRAEDSKNQDNFIADDDLLFTRLSGSLDYVANCALVRHLEGRRIQFPDRLFCAKLRDARMAAYIELCFGNPILRAELTEHAKSSAGHQRVSISDITGQRIPLPAILEQHEIVRRVEALFAYADRFGARYTAARARIEHLTPALLAKAFRGELVPQDPNDEPASELLASLQVACAAAPAKAKSRARKQRV